MCTLEIQNTTQHLVLTIHNYIIFSHKKLHGPHELIQPVVVGFEPGSPADEFAENR